MTEFSGLLVNQVDQGFELLSLTELILGRTKLWNGLIVLYDTTD